MTQDRLYSDRDLAQFYDLDNGWGPDLEYCLELSQDAGSMLDLGCGTGLLLAHVGGHCPAVGVEPAGAMLEIARARPGGDAVTWIEGDARAVRLDRRSTWWF
jgi:ubiquinone/menaquinone biosynthesis C-methylase UbiE